MKRSFASIIALTVGFTLVKSAHAAETGRMTDFKVGSGHGISSAPHGSYYIADFWKRTVPYRPQVGHLLHGACLGMTRFLRTRPLRFRARNINQSGEFCFDGFKPRRSAYSISATSMTAVIDRRSNSASF